MKKGLILVEGVDGAGKTSFCSRLQSFVKGVEGGGVDLISFPSASIKEQIRANPDLSVSLFLSDITAGLMQHLNSPNWLICDRSFISTMAYQGIGIETVTNYLPPVLMNHPMIYIWLDWPITVLMENLGYRQQTTGVLSGIGINEAPPVQAAIEKAKEKYDKAWAEWTSVCRMRASKKVVRLSVKSGETFDKSIDRFIRDEAFGLLHSLRDST